MNAVHFTTMLHMLSAGDPVELFCWRADGSILHIERCIPLPNKASTRVNGCQNFKILTSSQIRRIRLVCIFRINDQEVFL